MRIDYEVLARPRFTLLTEQQREGVAQAALEILERTGVHLTHPGAVERLHAAGARLEAGVVTPAGTKGYRVRLPAALVENALRSAPSQLLIYDRAGAPAMRLGTSHYYFGANMDAPDVFDPYSHTHHSQREEDCARQARLIDALPHLSFLMSAGFSADRPPAIADRCAARQALTNTSKPVLVITLSLASLEAVREMAVCIAGGDDRLRRRPCLLHYSEPISPLLHPDDAVEKLIYCAEWEIPLVYTPYLAMGATAPFSLAGALAQACAESLSGLVLHQLVRPGAPFIFGGMPSVMDMRTTVFSYAAPELQMLLAGMAEMARYFHLPNFGTAGCGDAVLFDGQAVLEATSSCMMAALSGGDLIHDVGLFGSAQVVIPEMYVVVDEIVGMLHRLLGGLAVDEETLATDLIDAAGPGGEFLTHPHTLGHFRESWSPELLFRGGYNNWLAGEQNRFEERVTEKTRQLMETHSPPALPADVLDDLDRMAREWEEEPAV